ncbi:unnamed protein product [Amoebophrya sp. A25]|nr:unnamed protein product [Amoebophrya sp. A25]|eukprot:GSA25T00017401001.1
MRAYGYRVPSTWVYPRRLAFLEGVGAVWAWNRPERVLGVKYGGKFEAKNVDTEDAGTSVPEDRHAHTVIDDRSKKDTREAVGFETHGTRRPMNSVSTKQGKDESQSRSEQTQATGRWLPNFANSTVERMRIDRLPESPLRICAGHHLSHKTMLSTGDLALPKRVNCTAIQDLPLVLSPTRPLVGRREEMEKLLPREVEEASGSGRSLAQTLMDYDYSVMLRKVNFAWIFLRCETLRKRVSEQEIRALRQLCFFQLAAQPQHEDEESKTIRDVNKIEINWAGALIVDGSLASHLTRRKPGPKNQNSGKIMHLEQMGTPDKARQQSRPWFWVTKKIVGGGGRGRSTTTSRTTPTSSSTRTTPLGTPPGPPRFQSSNMEDGLGSSFNHGHHKARDPITCVLELDLLTTSLKVRRCLI